MPLPLSSISQNIDPKLDVVGREAETETERERQRQRQKSYLDSIRNSCDVYVLNRLLESHFILVGFNDSEHCD